VCNSVNMTIESNPNPTEIFEEIIVSVHDLRGLGISNHDILLVQKKNIEKVIKETKGSS
jgi:hypothetical protein